MDKSNTASFSDERGQTQRLVDNKKKNKHENTAHRYTFAHMEHNGTVVVARRKQTTLGQVHYLPLQNRNEKHTRTTS